MFPSTSLTGGIEIGRIKIDTASISEFFSDESVSLGTYTNAELEAKMMQKAFGFMTLFTKYMCAFSIIILLLAVNMLVSMWIIFEKAGQPGWAAIVPFYNMWVLAEVGDKPGWYGLLACLGGGIPFIGGIISLVFTFIVYIGAANTFNRGALFGIGLVFFPNIFFPILAFSSD